MSKYYIRLSLGSLLGTIAYILCGIVGISLDLFAMKNSLSPTQGVAAILLIFILPPLLYVFIVHALSKPLRYVTRSIPVLLIIYYLLNFFVLLIAVHITVAVLGDNSVGSFRVTSITGSFFSLVVYALLTGLLILLNPFSYSNRIAGENLSTLPKFQ